MKKKLKICCLVTLLILPVAYVTFISRPDRGGISRCKNIMMLNELDIYLGQAIPILPWEPFEDPKFKFNLKPGKNIMKYLVSDGYINWQVGGIKFGSIDVGSESYEDNIYAYKNLNNGGKIFISMSKIRNEIIFVLR